MTKTNGTLLFKCLAAFCVLHSVGASSTRQLSTATSSAQPPTISCVPSPCLRRPPVSPRTSPEEPRPQPSPLTAHRSPLTFHHRPHPHRVAAAAANPAAGFAGPQAANQADAAAKAVGADAAANDDSDEEDEELDEGSMARALLLKNITAETKDAGFTFIEKTESAAASEYLDNKELFDEQGLDILARTNRTLRRLSGLIDSYPVASSPLTRALRAETHAACLRAIQSHLVDNFKPHTSHVVTLADPAYHNNLGDNFLNYGELVLLARLGATHGECGLAQSQNLNPSCMRYSFPRNSTIMFQAGGNWGDLYRSIQRARLRSLDQIAGMSRNVNVVSMPQSLAYMSIKHKQIEAQDAARIQRMVSNGLNLTLTWRETEGFEKAQKLYPGATNVLSPDIAFMIGQVRDTRAYTKRTMHERDILFLIRKDSESAVGGQRAVLQQLLQLLGPAVTQCQNTPHTAGCDDVDRVRWSMHDWVDVRLFYNQTHVHEPPPMIQVPSRGKFNYNACVKSAVAMFATAKVVVSDRMHGGILAFLMNKPHVVIDQVTHKATRTRAVAFNASASCRRKDVLLYEHAANVTDAVDKAKAFLAITKQLDLF